MTPAALLAIIQVVESLLVSVPEVAQLWTTIKTMLAANQDPTSDQWAALVSQTMAAHAAVQGTPAPAPAAS